MNNLILRILDLAKNGEEGHVPSSLSILDIDQRKLVYEQMDSIIINEAPVVPLYYDMAVRFVNKKVTGLGINPQNFLVLKRVKKSN